MTSTSSAILAATLAAAVLAACNPQGAALPSGALVSCAGDPDCPSGTFCKLTLGRCVSVAGGDQTPPGVVPGSASLAPAVVAAGGTLTVAFDSDEPLAGPPVVEVLTAGGRRAAALVSSQGVHHVFAFAPGGADQEGLAEVRAQLVDPAGNLTRDAAVGTVTLDFTPPALVPGSDAVVLAPAPGSPLRAVAALGAGGVGLVSFTMSEPLAAPPAVTAAGSPDLPLELVSQAGTTYLFRLALDPGPWPREVRALRVGATDVAGNEATALPLQVPLTVDGTPPGPPVVTAGEAPVVELTRIPWGSEATGGAARATVAGVAGAVEGGVTVVLTDGPGLGALEVGRAVARADGAFEASLLADPPDLWATAVDDAGNAGDRTRVVDVAWVTSLGGKQAGSSAANPHRLEARAWYSGALEQADGVEASGAQVGPGATGGPLVTSSAAAFFPVARAGAPAARRDALLVADPGRGRVVLYGGARSADAVVLTDAWDWDGWRWVEAQVSDPEGDAGPGRQFAGMAAYDGRNGAVLLLTQSGSTSWLWDGRSWRAAAPEPGTAVPEPRFSGAMSYDAGRGRLVLFGGSEYTDTWEWDGARWWNRSGGAAPPRRREGRMVYDPLRRLTLLYGGQDVTLPADQYQLQTFAWDGQVWTDLGIPGPGPRANYGFAFDEARGEAVAFGGRVPFAPDAGLWALRWTGAAYAWQPVTPIDPEGDGDPAPTEGSMAWDGARQVVVWMGTDGLTWAWNGSSWSRRSPSDPEGDGHPTVGPFTPMAYDLARARTWVRAPDGLWSWDGASWARRIPDGALPSAPGTTLAYEPRTGALLLFGGDGGGGLAWTWTIDPETGVAAPAAQPAPAPSVIYSPSCATDTELSVATCFGGAIITPGGTILPSTETWSHDGVAWRRVDAPVPPALAAAYSGGFSFAYHPGLGRFVFYARGQVWTLRQEAGPGGFTGTWTEVAVQDPAGDGTPFRDGSLVYDSQRRALVLFEYLSPAALTWVWNPATSGFRGLGTANPLGAGGPEVDIPPLAFDPVAGQAVVMGSQPWVWDSGALARPAHVLHVAFRAAGGPDPAACPAGAASCPVREVRVRWRGGADAPGGAPALQAWQGRWTTLLMGTGTASAPSDLAWTSLGQRSPQEIAALFHGPERELTLALVPSGDAPLEVDALRRVATAGVEVTVRYRRD